MLKYHVAVCDDEKSDLDGIVQSVQRYDVQGCFDIETYMDGNELLSELQMRFCFVSAAAARNGGVYRCSGMRLYYYRYYSSQPQPQQGNGRKRAAQGRA